MMDIGECFVSLDALYAVKVSWKVMSRTICIKHIIAFKMPDK
jgi:hypothetical protein